MAEDILRETGGNALTMAMIGCLPDNVQQAIKSFSIKPGSQHVTFSFPFMAELLSKFRPDCYGGDTGVSQPLLTPGLFFDQSIDVIEGYQSYITLAPTLDRTVMPVALFTLHQKDTTEGIVKHFSSLIKVILDSKSLITVWKMPVIVIDLSAKILELIVDAITQTILDIQMENLIKTFPGKTKEELFNLVKEKMVVPNMRGYPEHFDLHVKEVASRLRSAESERFLAVVDHLRSVSCSAVDYQKADIMMKSPATEPLIKSFWRIWGQDQVACKVFPIAMASRGMQRVGSYHPLRTESTLDPSLSSLTNMPVKEGLQSIIKCLKAQDTVGLGIVKVDKMKGCSCNMCKSSSRYCDLKQHTDYHSAEEIASHSAFYRPKPALSSRYHTATPYSDALKAAAFIPAAGRPGGYLAGLDSTLSVLRADFRRTFVTTPAGLPLFPAFAPYTSELHSSSAAAAGVPLIYRPKILTHDLQYFRQ